MAGWQIWQLMIRTLCIGLVLLVEHVASMPLLSLLLLYWWFGRAYRFSVTPIIVYSIVVNVLYGGVITGVYVLLGLWWWLTTRKLGSKWLRSMIVFSSASLAVLTVFVIFKQVQILFAFGWILISGVVWWRLHAVGLGIQHGR